MNSYTRLHTWSLALSIGCLWGGCVFIVSLAKWVGQGSAEFTTVLTSVYLNEIDTWIECFMASFLAFSDGFIGGLLGSWLYNRFLSSFSC